MKSGTGMHTNCFTLWCIQIVTQKAQVCALNGIILSYFSNFPTNLQRFCGFLPRFSCSPMRLCAVFTAGLAFRSSNHTKVSHCSSLHQKSHNTQKRHLHEYKFYKNQLNLSAKHTGTANVYDTNFKQ